MSYELAMISRLNKKINQVSKPNKSNKVSTTFIGEDMYPQIGLQSGYNVQEYRGNKYILEGDVWVTEQFFIYSNVFNYNRTIKSNKLVLSIQDMVYIESIGLFLENVSENAIISLGDIELSSMGIEDDTYTFNYNRILYQSEVLSLQCSKPGTIHVDIHYRLLL